MNIEKFMYQRTKEGAREIVDIATTLETIVSLSNQGAIEEGKISSVYEKRQLRSIKNIISNIYLNLGLQEVEGMMDEIFNPDFKVPE